MLAVLVTGLLAGCDAQPKLKQIENPIFSIRFGKTEPVRGRRRILSDALEFLKFRAARELDTPESSLLEDYRYSCAQAEALTGLEVDPDRNRSPAEAGFALDLAISRARENGGESFLISLGGDLFAAGLREPGSPWRIGLRIPGIPESPLLGSFPLSNRAFVSISRQEIGLADSPDQPTGAGIAAPTAFAAAILAQALLASGPGSFLPFLRGLPGIDAVVIYPDGTLLISPGIYDSFRLEQAGWDVLPYR